MYTAIKDRFGLFPLRGDVDFGGTALTLGEPARVRLMLVFPDEPGLKLPAVNCDWFETLQLGWDRGTISITGLAGKSFSTELRLARPNVK